MPDPSQASGPSSSPMKQDQNVQAESPQKAVLPELKTVAKIPLDFAEKIVRRTRNLAEQTLRTGPENIAEGVTRLALLDIPGAKASLGRGVEYYKGLIIPEKDKSLKENATVIPNLPPIPPLSIYAKSAASVQREKERAADPEKYGRNKSRVMSAIQNIKDTVARPVAYAADSLSDSLVEAKNGVVHLAKGEVKEGVADFRESAVTAVKTPVNSFALGTVQGLSIPLPLVSPIAPRGLSKKESSAIAEVYGPSINTDSLTLYETFNKHHGVATYTEGHSYDLNMDKRGLWEKHPMVVVHETAHFKQLDGDPAGYIKEKPYIPLNNEEAYYNAYRVSKDVASGKRFSELNIEQQAVIAHEFYNMMVTLNSDDYAAVVVNQEALKSSTSPETNTEYASLPSSCLDNNFTLVRSSDDIQTLKTEYKEPVLCIVPKELMATVKSELPNCIERPDVIDDFLKFSKGTTK